MKWTADQTEALCALYGTDPTAPIPGTLVKFAASIGKNPGNVVRKARTLGLGVNQARRKVLVRKPTRATSNAEELRTLQSQRARERIEKNGHPRGMAGKLHTVEVKSAIAKNSRERAASMTEEEWTKRARKSHDTRLANGIVNERPNASWKAAWREIGGIRKYYRSRWEANYARYLELLKTAGKVVSWLHEPDTFWFETIKRGCRSYLPDFKVTYPDGRVEYHEVKGWMDDRSKTKIKRMAKYHPGVTLVVIGAKQYAKLARSVAALCPGWE